MAQRFEIVIDPARCAQAQTSIRRPREFAYFSYDAHRQLLPFSDASLAYYYPPMFDIHHASGNRQTIDLSQGYETFIKRDDSVDEHLDSLLATLQVHEERLLEEAQNGQGKISDVRVKADIVTWRGMMTKFMTSAFDAFNEFEMNATLFQGTIFIEEHLAAKKASRQHDSRQSSRRNEPTQDMMQYWGYKFEALSVLSKPWSECTRDEIETRDQLVVNNHAQYCSIVRTGIGGTDLVIAGEVDAVMGEKPQDSSQPIPWVELKTSQELQPNDDRDLLKFERKMLRFWAQSFLLGVPKIVVGFRDRVGHLVRIQELETQKLPQQVKKSTWAWDGNISINFTAQVLNFLKQTITGEGVWRIQRIKGQNTISIFQDEPTGTGRVLSDAFKKHREKIQLMAISEALGLSQS